MSVGTSISLHTLPVDIIYYILDNLDELQILLSVSNVCNRLNRVIHTYHRYEVMIIIDFTYTNKFQFQYRILLG